MAKKDTEKALRNRGIGDESIAKLLEEYATVAQVVEAGEAKLKELGLKEKEIGHAHQRSAAAAKVKKAPWRSKGGKRKEEESAPREHFEFEMPNKVRVTSKLEQKMRKYSEELGLDIPGACWNPLPTASRGWTFRMSRSRRSSSAPTNAT